MCLALQIQDGPGFWNHRKLLQMLKLLAFIYKELPETQKSMPMNKIPEFWTTCL
jgi:hypothetical protein